MNQVIVLTGPAGAGKTAVAEAICERFDRMLHVEVDALRHFVKAGYRHPWMEGDPQAAEQRLLAVRGASALAREAIAMRYAVVIDDVVFAENAGRYRESLAGAGCNVHFVLLLPALEAALARDREREPSIPERVRALHEAFRREADAGVLPGAMIDSTADAGALVTADRVLDAVAAGEALFIQAAT